MVFMLMVMTFLVFLTLQLTGMILWSWWVVTLPIWAPSVAVILLAAAHIMLGKKT